MSELPSGPKSLRGVGTGVTARDPRAMSDDGGSLGEGKPVTIGADDSVEETLRTMKEHGVRRLPVIDGHDLVGIVSQADIARNLPEGMVGDLVEAISSAP